MIGSRLGQPAGDHVGVADGLDLLQSVEFGEAVEGGEQLVERPHQLVGMDLLAGLREADQVGEHHGHVVELVGYHFLALLETVGDRGRKNVEEERLGSVLLGEEEVVGSSQPAAAADRLPEQQHRGQQGRVGDRPLEDQCPHRFREVGHQGEHDRARAEPDGQGQRHQSMPRRPGGSEGHREGDGGEDAGGVLQVVDLEARRRGQQRAQRPASPQERQGTHHRRQGVGDEGAGRTLGGGHGDGGGDRRCRRRRQRGVDDPPVDSESCFVQRRSIPRGISLRGPRPHVTTRDSYGGGPLH